jgi:hypothetical protein
VKREQEARVVREAEDRSRNMPDLGSSEKQRLERANQIFLRLRKDLHDRGARFTEKDVREAAQSARWLREIVEQHPGDWEQAYEAALSEANLTEEDEADLRRGVEKAGGFSLFIQHNLQRLEEAAPGEREQTGDPATEMTQQALISGVAVSLVAGGVMIGNSFYLGFGVGMARKADCW